MVGAVCACGVCLLLQLPRCLGCVCAVCSIRWPAHCPALRAPHPTLSLSPSVDITLLPPRALHLHRAGAYLQYDFMRPQGPGRLSVYEGSWVQQLNAAGFSVAGIDHQGAGRCFFWARGERRSTQLTQWGAACGVHSMRALHPQSRHEAGAAAAALHTAPPGCTPARAAGRAHTCAQERGHPVLQ